MDNLVAEPSANEDLNAVLVHGLWAAFLECLRKQEIEKYLVTLDNAVRVTGVSAVSKKANITRAGIYKALSPDGHPLFETLVKITYAVLELNEVDMATLGRTR